MTSLLGTCRVEHDGTDHGKRERNDDAGRTKERHLHRCWFRHGD